MYIDLYVYSWPGHYIYIYIYTEREKKRERGRGVWDIGGAGGGSV
jgi:hypothetical protein